MTSKQRQWNERYASADSVWGAEPNCFLAHELRAAESGGRLLDLACGEGRNAIWLAERGFAVTGVDYSEVAIERARGLAAARGVKVEWVCADVTLFEPPPGAFERVIMLYLQVPGGDRRAALRNAAAALAPGGELLMIGHALRNLTEGVGGPQQAAVLWDPDTITGELTALGLRVDGSEHLHRPVEGKGDAIDLLVRARRPQLTRRGDPVGDEPRR
jgi:SAM-dependent methyltransferase